MSAKGTPAQRFARIFELFLNRATPGERETAERKVNAWLKQHGKTRADIKAILAQAAADDAAQAPARRKDLKSEPGRRVIAASGLLFAVS